MSNGYLTSCAFIISMIITVVLFVKRGIGNLETKIFKKMLICNVLESLITTLIVIVALTSNSNLIFVILNRIDVILVILWCSLLFNYIYIITTGRIKQKVKNFTVIVDSIIIIFALILKVTIIASDGILNSEGPLTDLGLYGSVFYIILMILTILIAKSKKVKIDEKKYIPLYFLIFLLIGIAILRTVIPEINFISILLSIIDLIMIFTIENPDLKMVNELLRNKELVEDQIEDKSDFLFEMSQEIKIPIDNIIELTKIYNKLENDIDKEKLIRMISVNASEIIFKTNNILDVSSMDANKIKIRTEDYNPYKLFNEIKVFIKNKIKDKKINLFINLNNNIPMKLSGDDIRLKQIMVSILINAVDSTDSGYINVTLHSINRYDVTRLIIKVEDSGRGMSIDKINEILGNSKDLTSEEVSKLDKLDVDLSVAIKMIKLLGGNINIKSVEGKGTTIYIVVDQKLKLEKVTGVMKNIEKYSSDVYGRKRVLIVDVNKDEIFKIKNVLSKYNLDINSTMIAKECIDRVKSGELYNLIIIDDELRTSSALSVIKKLREIKKFNVPVVVMLNKSKEHFKNNYIEDGFKDFILKDQLTDELEKIISKNL